MQNDYFLTIITDNHTKIEDIRKLSQEEVEKFKKASKILHKLYSKLYFYYMVDYGYNELIEYKNSLNSEITKEGLLFNEMFTFEYYRLLHNYLSSVNLFLNQYSANIKRDYDKSFSDEFDTLCKDLYAENISFRIIYHLRNELEHSKLPDFGIDMKRKNFYEFECVITIPRDFLLTIDKLKNDEELKKMEEEIDIIEQMRNMNSYLRILAKKIIEYELNNLWEYYEFLKSLLNEVKIQGKLLVSKNLYFSENGFQKSFKFIRKDLINLLDNMSLSNKSIFLE